MRIWNLVLHAVLTNFSTGYAMTDKERYEAAMEENHRLREELKDWKTAHAEIVKDATKNKKDIEEYRSVNSNLTKQLMIQEGVVATLKDQKQSLLDRNKELEGCIARKNDEILNIGNKLAETAFRNAELETELENLTKKP